MKTSVRDYLHTLNVLNKDIDVSVDGTDICIAVCGGEIKITPYGEEVYKEVLDNENLYVDVAEFGNCILSENDDDYYLVDDDEGALVKASEFLYALAGYCGSGHYAKCFEGDDAKLI